MRDDMRMGCHFCEADEFILYDDASAECTNCAAMFDVSIADWGSEFSVDDLFTMVIEPKSQARGESLADGKGE